MIWSYHSYGRPLRCPQCFLLLTSRRHASTDEVRRYVSLHPMPLSPCRWSVQGQVRHISEQSDVLNLDQSRRSFRQPNSVSIVQPVVRLPASSKNGAPSESPRDNVGWLLPHSLSASKIHFRAFIPDKNGLSSSWINALILDTTKPTSK